MSDKNYYAILGMIAPRRMKRFESPSNGAAGRSFKAIESRAEIRGRASGEPSRDRSDACDPGKRAAFGATLPLLCLLRHRSTGPCRSRAAGTTRRTARRWDWLSLAEIACFRAMA